MTDPTPTSPMAQPREAAPTTQAAADLAALEARRAFVAGARWALGEELWRGHGPKAIAEAARRYPLPTEEP